MKIKKEYLEIFEDKSKFSKIMSDFISTNKDEYQKIIRKDFNNSEIIRKNIHELGLYFEEETENYLIDYIIDKCNGMSRGKLFKEEIKNLKIISEQITKKR